MGEFAINGDGDLVLLDGEPAIDVPTRSGNPAHGVATGRFGRPRRPKQQPSGGEPGPPPQSQPDNGSEDRRRDAVADAARTLDDLSPEGVRELVVKRWRGARALTDADVQSFSEDAQVQRMDDVVDALDSRLRGNTQSSKSVKVDAPRGWIRKTLRGMDDDQVVRVLQRLRERGWTAAQIKTHIVRPFDDERKRMVIPKVSLEDE